MDQKKSILLFAFALTCMEDQRRCSIHVHMHLTPGKNNGQAESLQREMPALSMAWKSYRHKHLCWRLEAARDIWDEISKKKILVIIQCEKERAFWCHLNCALGKKRGQSVPSLQVEYKHGNVVEHNTQASVQEEIWHKVVESNYILPSKLKSVRNVSKETLGTVSSHRYTKQSWMTCTSTLGSL